ncbi:MAG: flagellar protein FlaG [Thermofilaceae archaeon]|nr:flagellar protein FlaG [Armatimonadota bacterium]
MERIGGVTPGKGIEATPPSRHGEKGRKASHQDVEPKPSPSQEGQAVSKGGSGEAGRDVKKPPSPMDVAAEFIVDQKTHRVTVRIMNVRTGEVIRIIPPGKLIELISQLTGRSVIDKKV